MNETTTAHLQQQQQQQTKQQRRRVDPSVKTNLLKSDSNEALLEAGIGIGSKINAFEKLATAQDDEHKYDGTSIPAKRYILHAAKNDLGMNIDLCVFGLFVFGLFVFGL